MPADRTDKLPVVLCWHMHQPDYRDPSTGVATLPWTYLHATKDYTDMAAHLERVPGARAVVNFSPILLEQLSETARAIRVLLSDDGIAPHPLLGALAGASMPAAPDARRTLIGECTRLTRVRAIERVPALARLLEIADFAIGPAGDVSYLNDQYLADLLVAYHLAWFGEHAHRRDARVQRLLQMQRDYTHADRRELLGLIAEAIESLPGRYRALAESGAIELSMNPYSHPIVPLLLDVGSAREAAPSTPLPVLGVYPGGEARVREQIERGLQVFERCIGIRPTGFWPSEGAISTATLTLLAQYGFGWAASGRAVLSNTLRALGLDAAAGCTHRPYRVAGSVPCYFRDDGLSDLIGFSYAGWPADDAATDLLAHLRNIRAHCDGVGGAVATIIVDGENAWEHYAANGHDFLAALYSRLASDESLSPTTFSAHAAASGGVAGELPAVVAGSWVYGTLSTWIGHPAKNRAFDWLVAAKEAFDRRLPLLDDNRQEAARQALALCECSDWSWWLDDHHEGGTVSVFQRLYALHLQRLYDVLGEPLPAAIAETLARQAVEATHGPMLTADGNLSRD